MDLARARRTLLLAMFATGLACNGLLVREGGGSGTESDASATAGDATTIDVTAVDQSSSGDVGQRPTDGALVDVPAPGPEQCPSGDGQMQTVPDIPTFTSKVVGQWLLCSALGVDLPPAVQSGVAGLEVLSDGHFSVLTWDSAHTNVIRRRTIEHVGNYTVEANAPNQFQVNFNFDAPFIIMAVSHLTTGPAELVMNNNGAFIYRYVPWAEAFPANGPLIEDEPDPTPDGNGCAAIGVVENGVSPPQVVQSWRLCSGAGTGQVTNESGLELDPNGRYTILTGPSLVPGTGPWATGGYVLMGDQLSLLPDWTGVDGGGGGNTLEGVLFTLTESPPLFVGYRDYVSSRSSYAPLDVVADGGPDG